jgi:class 3 adenylate cyclase/HAMP domain-containing protein
MAKKDRRRIKKRVGFSLRWKITLPFIFLALTLGLGAAFLVNQLLKQTEEFQFLRQLADSGQQATDAVVRIEVDLLEVERLMANTEGVSQAAALQNSEDLRSRILPLVINAGVDVAAILDDQAVSLLVIRHRPGGPAGDYEILKGETIYQEWDFVQQVLTGESDAIGDKNVGLKKISIGDLEPYVFFIGGPLRDNQGGVIGAAMVGMYLENVAARISEQAGANISIYGLEGGSLLTSSLEPQSNDSLILSPSHLNAATSTRVDQNLVRNISVSGSVYTEILTKFQARQGTSDLGILGISLLQAPIEGALLENVFNVAKYGAIALLLVVAIGLLLSNTITRPLVEIAEASEQVAAGNLDSFVKTRSNDEIGVLARSFNTMVKELKNGFPKLSQSRDLQSAGDPTTNVALPAKIESDEPMTYEATIMAADLSSFIRGSEFSNPKSILKTLNECYSAMLPIIHQHGGEIGQFDGDGLVAFFGILPNKKSPAESTLYATHAGLEILSFVERWNSQRSTKGLPALEIWLGITSGPVIAGGIGETSQLRFSVVGDTVQEARSIQGVCREMGRANLLISEKAYENLSKEHQQFKFGRFGKARLRHSGLSITVYEVNGRRARLLDEGVQRYSSWNRGKDAHGS